MICHLNNFKWDLCAYIFSALCKLLLVLMLLAFAEWKHLDMRTEEKWKSTSVNEFPLPEYNIYSFPSIAGVCTMYVCMCNSVFIVPSVFHTYFCLSFHVFIRQVHVTSAIFSNTILMWCDKSFSYSISYQFCPSISACARPIFSLLLYHQLFPHFRMIFFPLFYTIDIPYTYCMLTAHTNGVHRVYSDIM